MPKHWSDEMRPWKAVLGIGAACAACCAVPLIGGAAMLTAGTAALAATGSALLACADEFVVPGTALLGLSGLAGGVIWWRRRTPRPVTSASGCGGGCDANHS